MNVHPSGVIGEFLESRFSMSVLSPVAAVELFEFEDSLASRDGGRLPGIGVRFQRRTAIAGRGTEDWSGADLTVDERLGCL